MTPKNTRHILKANEVALDDPVRLAVDPTPATCCGGSRSAAVSPIARITQTHPEYAVIEVTCSCGKTTQIRCDYVAGPPAGVRQASTPGNEAMPATR